MKLRCNQNVLDLSTPVVMGILNITPDSFYDGGRYKEEAALLNQARKMINEGASIIDIGAYSTRPNAKEVPEEEELKRLIPAIKLIRKNFPEIIISADTFRAKVAYDAVNVGANIINDISGGGFSKKEQAVFFKTIATLDIPYILMHIQGTPTTMQQNPTYGNIVEELKQYFLQKIDTIINAGVNQIIIDPGFGFGKTIEHNYTLIKHLNVFAALGYPVLVGISRKSMINKLLNTTPNTALNATTAVHTIALLKGASILRVHDVKEANEAIKIVNFIKNLK